MSTLAFYKPNPRNTGSAASFSCRKNREEEEYQCYLNIVKQVSWDDKSKKGKFKSDKEGNDISVKFNAIELGGICRAIAGKEEFSTVHQFANSSTSITLKWFDMPNGKKIFSVSAIRDGSKFGIGLTHNEAYVLQKFCDNAILRLLQD